MALGATGYENRGESSGLVITSLPAENPEDADTGNLNPGDIKKSSLQLKNNGTSSFTVYIRTVITEEKPKDRLSKALRLTIIEGGNNNPITNASFSDAAGQGNISLGTMAPGSSKTLNFTVELPKGTDNEYQGSSLSAKWVFTTVSGGGGDYGGSPPPEYPPEEIEVPPDDEPLTPEEPGEEEPEEEINVPTEEEPKMPGTGVGSSLPYYAAGSAVVLAGLLLSKRKKK
ncbi:MAG: hypothetical protein GX091_02900 [Peptococcaceae bacterium]|nr:hypothetical protein [Peptococcaceae bacterium]